MAVRQALCWAYFTCIGHLHSQPPQGGVYLLLLLFKRWKMRPEYKLCKGMNSPPDYVH
jgi:hypothetical protein